jgi:hypothetical protein
MLWRNDSHWHGIQNGNGFTAGNQNYLCLMSCCWHAILSEGQTWSNRGFQAPQFYMAIAARRPSDVAATVWRKNLSTHFVSYFNPFPSFPRIRSYNSCHNVGTQITVTNTNARRLGFYSIMQFYWDNKKPYFVRWRFQHNQTFPKHNAWFYDTLRPCT